MVFHIGYSWLTNEFIANLLKELRGKGNKDSVNVDIIEKSENYDETYEKLIKILSESKTPKGQQTVCFYLKNL